ncbi:MAG: transglutaminase-like domain-containing protein [Planctomycetota bacterium]
MLTSRRRRVEVITLAVLAIVSVLPLRYSIESSAWFIAELVTWVGLLCVAEFCRGIAHRRHRQANQTADQLASALVWKNLSGLAATLLLISPIVFAFLARWSGSPIAIEMSALSTFGTAALAMALLATTTRVQAMSLVGSGFLTLFATSISDNHRSVILAVIWMTVCVWHLVANHWEKLDVCMPDRVRRNVGIRPLSVLAAIVLCIVGGLIVRDRFGPSNRFTFGIMPTSGGSKWSDPAARSGIGSGDAAIAAKDHAESFGAVESDILLESQESTLFDMFSDMYGEPKKRKIKYERRQAMNNQKFIPLHHRVAKSEQGSGSFSTERVPPKNHRELKDKLAEAIIQWSGPTGIRLAMRRYDTFDGVDWTNTSDHFVPKLSRHPIEDRVWFFAPNSHRMMMEDADAVSVDLLKVLRLKSARLPVPMLSAGLHIKDIDTADFFGIEKDGSLFMPGRDKVPPLTVVHVASLSVMEDKLTELTANERTFENGDGAGATIPWFAAVADELARMDVDENASPYQQLRTIVDHLRSDFTYDPSLGTQSDDPVSEFLGRRSGGSYLFATCAALMARQIGLQSRIVTGFYVRPDSVDITAGHSDVLPDDVHVWTEIKLADGRWFEIEPTPGYREPRYTPSLWLSTKRFAIAYWLHGLLAITVAALAYLTRVIWIEWLMSGGWALSRCVKPRRQLAIAMKIVETRARLVGSARPKGQPQRDWLESLVTRDLHLQDHVRRFCDTADGVVFGGNAQINRGHLSSVVRGLKAKRLKSAAQKETS